MYIDVYIVTTAHIYILDILTINNYNNTALVHMYIGYQYVLHSFTLTCFTLPLLLTLYTTPSLHFI